MKNIRRTSFFFICSFLVLCRAELHQEQDSGVYGPNSAERFDAGTKSQIIEAMDSDKWTRQIRDTRPNLIPFYLARQLDYSGVHGGKREWPSYAGYYALGLPKRNFDEIDRSGLNNFVKRNFDEIDVTSLPFPNMLVNNKRSKNHHWSKFFPYGYYPVNEDVKT